jgi:hypothetical protein
MNSRQFSFRASLLATVAVSAALTSACGADGAVEKAEGEVKWNQANNPAFIDPSFVYRVDQLPLQGAPDLTPIASTYWPVYADSINARWDGEDSLSPAEKFAKAFGKDVKKVTDGVSRENGIDSRAQGGVEKYKAKIEEIDRSLKAIEEYLGQYAARAAEIDAAVAALPETLTSKQKKRKARLLKERADIVSQQDYLNGLKPQYEEYKADLQKSMPQACSATDEDSCDDGVCGLRVDPITGATAESGWCIPTWWGICHGWAPYAISEPRITEAFEFNGVTFYPGDVEGLMSFAYAHNLPSKMMSERCNKDDVSFNELGRLDDRGDIGSGSNDPSRIEDDACSDTNAGSFHVLVTNLLGLKGQGFVMDKTLSSEVWNQPVVGFRVTNAQGDKLEEITMEQAITLLQPESTDMTQYIFNSDARRFFKVDLELDWISEGSANREANDPRNYLNTEYYSYVLEALADGTIIGGEWEPETRYDHPDFLWYPTAKPQGSAAGGTISYAEVKQIQDAGIKPAP